MKFVVVVAILSVGTFFLGCKSNSSSNVGNAQVIKISVTEAGFVPSNVTVTNGKPVKMIITRRTDKTCATEVVFKDFGINKQLPLNQPVEVVFTPTKTGMIHYTCGMNMVTGMIDVQ